MSLIEDFYESFELKKIDRKFEWDFFLKCTIFFYKLLQIWNVADHSDNCQICLMSGIDSYTKLNYVLHVLENGKEMQDVIFIKLSHVLENGNARWNLN